MNVIISLLLSSTLLLQSIAYAGTESDDFDNHLLIRTLKDATKKESSGVGTPAHSDCYTCTLKDLPRACPKKLDAIQRDMQKTGWFNIDAPTKECRGAFPGEGAIKAELKKANVAPAENIELALGQKIYEKYGLSLSRKEVCLFGDENKKAISLAEYYSNIDRLSRGVLGAVDQLANLDGILGRDPLVKECLQSENKKLKEAGQTIVLPKEHEACLNHQSCQKEDGSRFGALAQETEDFLRLRNLLKDELAQRRNSNLDCLALAPSLNPEKDFNHFGDNKVVFHQDLKVAYSSLLNAYNDERQVPAELKDAIYTLKQKLGDAKILASFDNNQAEAPEVTAAKNKINRYFHDRFSAVSPVGGSLVQVRNDLRRLASIDQYIEEQLKKRKAEYSTKIAASTFVTEEVEMGRGPGPKRIAPKVVTQAETYIEDPEKKAALRKTYQETIISSNNGPRTQTQARALLKDRLQLARENVTGFDNDFDRDVYDRLLENMIMAARNCNEGEKTSNQKSPEDYQKIQAKLTELDHLGEMIYPWVYKKHFQAMRDSTELKREDIDKGLAAQLNDDRNNLAKVLKNLRKAHSCHTSEDIKCDEAEMKRALSMVPFSSENNLLGTDVRKSGNPHAWSFVEALNCTETIKEQRKISDDAIWSIYETGIVSVATLGLGAVISSARLAALTSGGSQAAKASRIGAMFGLVAIDGGYIGKGIATALNTCRAERDNIKVALDYKPASKEFLCPIDNGSALSKVDKSQSEGRSCLWAALGEGIINGLPAIPGVVGLTRHFKAKQQIQKKLLTKYPNDANEYTQKIVPDMIGNGYVTTLMSKDGIVSIPIKASSPEKAAQVLHQMKTEFPDEKFYDYLLGSMKSQKKKSFTDDEILTIMATKKKEITDEVKRMQRELSDLDLQDAPDHFNLMSSIHLAGRDRLSGRHSPLLVVDPNNPDKFRYNLIAPNKPIYFRDQANINFPIQVNSIEEAADVSALIDLHLGLSRTNAQKAATFKSIADYKKLHNKEFLTINELKQIMSQADEARVAQLSSDIMRMNSTRTNIVMLQKKAMENAPRGRIYKINSQLMPRNDQERMMILEDVLKRKPTPLEQTLVNAAHNIGAGNAKNWSYTKEEIAEKYFLLRDAGFENEEAKQMILRGVTGGENVVAKNTPITVEFSDEQIEAVDVAITQINKALPAKKTVVKKDAQERLAAFREHQKQEAAAKKIAEKNAAHDKTEIAKVKRDQVDWTKEAEEEIVINSEKPRNEFNFDEGKPSRAEEKPVKPKVRVIFAGEEPKPKGLMDTVKGWFGF